MDGKRLIVCYSLEGNSMYAANQVSKLTGIDIERIVPESEPPKKGIMKFLKGGGSVIKKDKIKISEINADIESCSEIIIACPVWASSFPPAIRAFLSCYDLKGKKVHMIGCSSSGIAEKMFRKAEGFAGIRLSGKLSLKDPLKHKDEADAAIRVFSEKYLI